MVGFQPEIVIKIYLKTMDKVTFGIGKPDTSFFNKIMLADNSMNRKYLTCDSTGRDQ